MFIRAWIQSFQLRQQIIPHLRYFFTKTADNLLNEQAVPSYLHPAFLLRETFWLRIALSHSHILPGQRVLDFGSGLGAMLPWHLKSHREVFLYDTHSLTQEYLNSLKENSRFNNFSLLTDFSALKKLTDGYFDTIVALDVLEHVENLPEVLLELKRLLSPKGQLLVSSPTENWIYKFARNFGGKGYKGEFHIRAAKEVEADLEKVFTVKLRNRLYPLLTFFRIVSATAKSAG